MNLYEVQIESETCIPPLYIVCKSFAKAEAITKVKLGDVEYHIATIQILTEGCIVDSEE